jgi:uncharacterized Zn finger protein
VCGCPYDWSGWCKHIVAALLASNHEPESIRDLPALEEVLSSLGKDRLRDLLLKLAERDPSLAAVIESELSLSTSPDARPVNAEAISSGGDLEQARRVLDGAWTFIRSDDARNALPVVEAITEEYMEAWETPDWGARGVARYGFPGPFNKPPMKPVIPGPGK